VRWDGATVVVFLPYRQPLLSLADFWLPRRWATSSTQSGRARDRCHTLLRDAPFSRLQLAAFWRAYARWYPANTSLSPATLPYATQRLPLQHAHCAPMPSLACRLMPDKTLRLALTACTIYLYLAASFAAHSDVLRLRRRLVLARVRRHQRAERRRSRDALYRASAHEHSRAR